MVVVRHSRILGAALALALLAPPSPAIAAEPAAAVEQLLNDKRYAEAEAAARAALAATAAETLEAANISRLLGDALFYQKRYREAEPHFRLALTIREKLLGEHAYTAVSANDLAVVLRQEGRFAEAEPFARRTLAIRESVLGRDHPDTAVAAYWVARTVDSLGRAGEAASLMEDALSRSAAAYGRDDPRTVGWWGEYAAILHDAGDPAAEAVYRGAIRAGEAVFQPADARLAFARFGLANLLRAADRNAEALPLLRLALAAREGTLGIRHPATVSAVDSLARALWALDEVAEADEMFRRLLAAREAESPVSANVADALRWLGRSAARRNRLAEAEVLYKRALDVAEAVHGGDHTLTAFDLIALAQLYSGQQRFAEAEPLLARAVSILDVRDETRRTAVVARMALSGLLHARGDTPGAIALAERSLDEMLPLAGEKSREAADITLSIASLKLSAGEVAEAERLVDIARATYTEVDPEGPGVLRAARETGHIRLAQGRPAEALAMYEDVLSRFQSRYGEDSEQLLSSLANVGRAQFSLGDFGAAAASFERNMAIVERLAAVDAAAAFASRVGDVEDLALARAGVFEWQVKSSFRLAEAHPDAAAAQAEKAFGVAQRVIESRAAGALAQMAARQATGSGPLAALARERQDLVERWRRQDAALTAMLSLPAAQRDEAALAALRSELAGADNHIRAIDAALLTDFPDFAALQSPSPLTISQVQAVLPENEVLLFFADTAHLGDTHAETFLWVVDRSGEPAWLRVDMPTGELSAAVQRLRRSMGVGGETRGAATLSRDVRDRTAETLETASQLYDRLIRPVEGLIAGKNLTIVPSRSLASLPFQLLVRDLPGGNAADRYRDAGWLVRDHAVTVLPSVASLDALGHGGPAGPARKTYAGFANPLLTGPSGDDRRAFGRAGCGQTQPLPVAHAQPDAAIASPTDLAAVRALLPLPETVDEACAIANILGGSGETVFQGGAATEGEVKRLSEDASLAGAGILHFATHGLMAGELPGLAEPAIVLTPPDKPSARDDGLLTASEIATLKLDADWVILSACNTAAGDGSGEALSGLARAFFYAGTRAMMVSHWPVNSDAAVRLATGAVGELAQSPKIGRAEALRRSMLVEIGRGGRYSDPANWAPFVLVGADR